MGSSHTKDHPKNLELIKYKRRLDTGPIKEAKLVNIWVIGGDKIKSLELAKMLADKQCYMLITEQSLIQTESESGSERGAILDHIIKDMGTVSPGIVLDLVVETLLSKLEGIKGAVFHGIPRNKEQAWHLERLIGPATLVVYCELKGEALRKCLTENSDELAMIKTKVDHFQKSIIQLLKHKNIIKIDGEADPSSLLDECTSKLDSINTY